MQHHVFLSYSRKDSSIMRRVRDDLRANGLTVWTDEGIEPGSDSWKMNIESAIKEAGCLVAILSPDSVDSRWVRAELDYAEAQRKKVYLILARGDESDAVPFGYAASQWMDIRQTGHYKPRILMLAKAIREYLDDTTRTHPKRPDMPPVGAHMTETAQNDLQPFNVFDQLRLFGWTFFRPQTLVDYQAGGGGLVVQQTAAWVVSALAWLPFFMPSLGYVLGTIQTPDVAALPGASLVAAGLLFMLGYFVTGWLGWRGQQSYGLASLIISAALSLSIYTMLPGMGDILFQDDVGMTGMIFLLTTAISIGVAAGIAFSLAIASIGTLVGIVIASVINSALSGLQLGILGGLAGVVMIGVAFSVGIVIRHNQRSGSPSPFGWLLVAALTISYGVMFWAYLLGGWRVLVG